MLPFVSMPQFPNAAQVTVWPEFHNGVAAALRVQPGSNALTRTWINSHKPEVTCWLCQRFIHCGDCCWLLSTSQTPSHRHGGFLLGLGLTGCLSQLTTPDLFELLQVGHDGTTIGVVLGLAACNLGTADVSTSKLLRLHVPAVLPVALSDIDVSPLVQAASLAGLGLVYAGTSNRMFVEFMLAQLGGRPVSERLDDRDAYCLCAGYALGWIALRRGGSMTDASLHDIGIESKLQRYMNGGPSFDVDAALVDPARSCRIKEGGDINVAVTAAGATVALGLMYLQTNDASAAKLLSLPSTSPCCLCSGLRCLTRLVWLCADTLFGLDGIRSDVMILRVVCHSVVMWDAIDATPHWIHSNIPSCVADVFERVLMKAKKDNVTLADLMASDAAAASDESTLHSIQDAMTDVTSVKEYHALSLAGACLAVGLKFAGTHDVLARETLLSTLAYFRTLRATFPDDDSKPAPSADIGCPPEEQLRPAVAAAIAPDRFTVEMCLCTVANALAVVMAGSGDVACLRVLRDVRERCDRAVSYGTELGVVSCHCEPWGVLDDDVLLWLFRFPHGPWHGHWVVVLGRWSVFAVPIAHGDCVIVVRVAPSVAIICHG
jgi:anaphase-promoting complex subunit 1